MCQMEANLNIGESQQLQSKLIRAPSLKRGAKTDDKLLHNRVKLESVFGLTVHNRSSIDCDSKTATVAYPAGCAVVLFNFQSNTQSFVGSEAVRKTIVCLAFSQCGRYLATGEVGRQPAVRVWDLYYGDSVKINPVQIAEHQTHYHSVNCVIFSPNNKFLVSIGSQHDMVVIVWDWRTDKKFASSKVSTKIRAVAFSADGSYFVTVGKRHVKFWYLEDQKSKIFKETSPLLGRSAILGELKNNYFCDVACEKPSMYVSSNEEYSGSSTFAITRSGCLCKFDSNRLMAQWVKLKTAKANCITVTSDFVFIGCSDAIIRCFHAATLQYVTTLPLTHHLGVDISTATDIELVSSRPMDAKYPDCEAITYDDVTSTLCCIYNDHSIYVWGVHDIDHVGKLYSNLYHSSHIWDIELIETSSFLASNYFVTCSYDNTIRLWSLPNRDLDNNHNSSKTCQIPEPFFMTNVYSQNLRKIIYLDDDIMALKEHNISVPANGTTQPAVESDNLGVRCIKLSVDNEHLACGLRCGNIIIYGITMVPIRELYQIEAHDCEVYSLDYSADVQKFLASAGKDRLLHIFDMSKDYQLVQTLDDHSSLITSVKFLVNMQQLFLISCGCDQSIIIRKLTKVDESHSLKFVRMQNIVHRMTLYDLALDRNTVGNIYVACHDKQIRVHDIESGKHLRCIKNNRPDENSTSTYIIRLTIDVTGTYIAAASFDKIVTIFDTTTGECIAIIAGYSELTTGLKFSNDCRRLITVSVRGCIFVWKLASDLVTLMQSKLPITTDQVNFRFSLNQLPSWAAKRLAPNYENASGDQKPQLPKGRWAQRFIQAPSVNFDTEGSVDSGIESNRNLDEEKTLRIEEYLQRNAEYSGEQYRFDDVVEDLSDNEKNNSKVYYLQSESFNRSEFPVTAIDKDLLRKSVRRKNRDNFLQVMSANPQATDNDELEDYDDDDDIHSSPPLSSEPTTDDKNPKTSSFFSLSMESLDRIEAPYEEQLFSQINFRKNQKSVKSAELSPGGSDYNYQTTTKMPEQTVISQLQKRIKDTIRTVSNAGTRSKVQKVDSRSKNDGKIRRSISLSDLMDTSISMDENPGRLKPKSGKSKPTLSVFNQNLMKPTISSQNKVNMSAIAHKSKNLRQYRSELNLSGQQDDSSSEEMNVKPTKKMEKLSLPSVKRSSGTNYRKQSQGESQKTRLPSNVAQRQRFKQCQEVCETLTTSVDSFVKFFNHTRNMMPFADYDMRNVYKLLDDTIKQNRDKLLSVNKLRGRQSDDESE